MRDLFEAAESRRAVSRRAEADGRVGLPQPGSLTFGASRKPAGQEKQLAMQFYRLVHALVRHDVPTYFLRFPDFARGEQDLYDVPGPLLISHGVTADESAAAMSAVSRPDLIHSFTPDQPG